MTCLWNGLRNEFGLPLIALRRRPWRRRHQLPILDLRLFGAHWRRDLGFDI